MKKWLLIIAALIALGIASFYFIFPSPIYVLRSVPVTATQEGTLRFLSSLENWKKFWPGTSEKKDTTILLSYKGYDFFIEKVFTNGANIRVQKNNTIIESSLLIMPYQVDSFKLEWISIFRHTNNPFKRARDYVTGTRLNNLYQEILDSMGASLSRVETIYGIEVKKDKIPIQQVITYKKYLDKYPDTETIYAMIDELKKFAVEQNVNQIDQPIFNVWPTEKSEFTTQVGISIDRNIAGNDKFPIKWMMKGGNMLSAKVKGGLKKIEWAKTQVAQYIADNHRSIIAAPFQVLVTDRRKEPDSDKWITLLYYPVI